MQNKYICIHGHFYQPPRENAWLEEIESQESAYPYHDWNERITAECYATNAHSRVLDGDGKIVDIVNNYKRISFNFGPTLLSWMEEFAPRTYEAILEGDLESQKLFGGHGSAIAQVYNHIIMPLANRKDKETQVKWGLYDFEKRFKRKSEGIWLAETAVDIETLEVLAGHDIKFTVLAPRQAKRFRKIGEEHWHEGINPQKHYLCKLPSGKSIVLFFYNGAVSQSVAFKGLLQNGRAFAEELVQTFDPNDHNAQLVHIATDGESYGHHHKHGDMALAFCLKHIEQENLAQITNYSQFLSLVEPEYEVEIHENSSWSCVHGVERWRSDCGCNTGGNPSWNQGWRSPLRESLDWLRDELIKIYEKEIKPFSSNSWELRNRFIQVILDRDKDNVKVFLEKNILVQLSQEDKTFVLRLLEMQRHALLMFTSCAWFFDEISGIETVQVLQYANRAIQIAESVGNIQLEEQFLERLSKGQSNIPEHKNGAEIYRKFTSPARISLSKVGMHYAVASLFEENAENLNILNYRYENHFFKRFEAGIQRLALGRTTLHSNITHSRKDFCFAVLYLGQHQIVGSAIEAIPKEEFRAVAKKIECAFGESNISEVVQIMQKYFPKKNFSIWQLFKDERIKVLNKILKENIEYAETSYRRIYDRNYNILNVMRSADLGIPKILKQNMANVVNQELEDFFEKRQKGLKKLQNLSTEIKRWKVDIDKGAIAYHASSYLDDLAFEFSQKRNEITIINQMQEVLSFLHENDIEPRLDEVQNQMFKTGKRLLWAWQETSQDNDEEPSDLIKQFIQVCNQINLRLSTENLSKKAESTVLDLFG